MGENKKSSKIGFPSRGKIKNHRKSPFPHGGKQEIIENRFSPVRENKKSSKISFPKLGKNKKRRWLRFPILGKTKSPRKLGEITFGGQVYFATLSFL